MSEAAKFKVGDRVRFTDKCSDTWWFGTNKEWKVGTVAKKDADYLYDVRCENGKFAYVTDSQIELIAAPFKIGDRVTVHSHQYSFKDGAAGTIVGKQRRTLRGEWRVCGKYEDGSEWYLGFFEMELRHADVHAIAPAQHAIVALIENGQPKPAIRPFVRADIADATKEAERLAGIHPGQKFGVYQLVTARIGTVSVAEA